MTEQPRDPRPADHAALWLAALEQIGQGAAHELKNALNGVSVNLTVVESRLRRQQAAESVTRFADAAVSQLDLLAAQVDALLELGRPARGALDLGVLARQLVVLSGRGPSGDAPFSVTLPAAGEALTAVDPAIGRTLVAAVLGPALAQPGPGSCTADVADGGACRLTVRADTPALPDAAIARLAAACGATLARAAPGEVVVTFPPARGPAKL